MNILILILCMYFVKAIFALHLTNFQLKSIKKLIQNPRLNIEQRLKIKLILYKAYEKWAIKKAIKFICIHKHKCFNIDLEEFIFASKIGLYKSVNKYNGKYDLINYSTIYINSEMLHVLTDSHSSSILPKNIRRKNKVNMTRIEKLRYNFLLEVKPLNSYENWKSDLIFQNKENVPSNFIEIYEKKELLNQLVNYPIFTKRILYLKYCFYANKIPSNKWIAELMCCSEETVRQELLKVKLKQL